MQKLLREGALKGDARAVAAAHAAAREPRQAKPPQDGLKDVLVELRKELVALRDTLAKLRR